MELVAFLLCSLVMLSGYGVRGQTKPPPPSQEYPGDYIILAPNTIHPGLPLTLSVNILNSAVGVVPVTATILKNGRETIASASQNFNGGMSGVLTLQMPSVATAGAYSLKVSATGQQLAFEETQDLTFKREGFAILVQSDKAIYKPGQTIMFRAMAVYPDLKPYTGAFDIEMKDPDGNIVKQWMGLENTNYGVVSGEMYMSEEARLGDWVIKVTANGQDYEHMVEVSEYVLPKFEVTFILPPYATNTDAEIAGMVEAKYTYGQPVKGTATVKVTYNPGYVAWNDYGPGNQEEPPSIVRSNVKIDGTGDIRFTKSEIERAFSINLSEIYNQVVLEFNAEVTETLTGIKQEGDGSIPISKYPIQVTEVTGNPENFKPGLPYTAYVSVTHIDDSPLTKSERLKGLGVRITKDYANEQSTDNVHSIPESGIVKIGIIPEEGATNYEIKVYYLDYAPPNNNYYCGNCLSITLQDAESPSSTFLQITTESSDLATGDTATFSILTTEVPGTLQYQIVSRGDIVHTESITAGTTDTLLEFVVTAEMAPSPRLVVFYIREADGELILASINFKVSGVFENDVSVEIFMDKVEPGHDVSLDITAAANSFIGILAIDQSVRLLKTGNDITQDQVIQAVEEFDTTSGDNNEGPFFRGRRRREAPSRSKRSIWCPWCWNPIGGTTVREVIDNAGMLVFTNGLIHGNDNTGDGSYWNYFGGVAGGGVAGGRPPIAYGRFPEVAGGGEDEDGDYDENNLDADDSTTDTVAEKKSRIRTEFPETWLWTEEVTECVPNRNYYGDAFFGPRPAGGAEPEAERGLEEKGAVNKGTDESDDEDAVDQTQEKSRNYYEFGGGLPLLPGVAVPDRGGEELGAGNENTDFQDESDGITDIYYSSAFLSASSDTVIMDAEMDAAYLPALEAENDNYYWFGGPVPAFPAPAPGIPVARGDGGAPELDEETNNGDIAPDNNPVKTRIRTEFPETWLWNYYYDDDYRWLGGPLPGVPYPAPAAGMPYDYLAKGDAAGGAPELDEETNNGDIAPDNNNLVKTRIRTEFPETWLWSDYVADANGNLQVSSKAPDTITSWVASAFGMSKTAGIGVADPTATIKVFKNFFISLNLPYSVVRGELLALQVTVFNYMSTEVTADITLVRSDGFDNVKVEKKNAVDGTSKDKNTYTYVSKDQVISAKIPANDGVTVSFPIKPKKLGMVDLTVKAESKIAADAITQPLLVKPEGVPLSSSEAVFVDLSVEAPYTKVFSYNLPSVENGLVDGSVRGVITATGDIMGPTIAGLDKLLQMPTGCGEQNMIYFAPDVFIYKYLESTNQENGEIKDKAIKFMEIGHSRELEYQHKTNDVGAFSAFGDSDESGSTWLTAFVIKSFVQASPYIYINIPKVEQALAWMLRQQKGGVFNEPGRVIHTDMQGNVNSDLTMTAYVLIALQEVIRSANISQSARTQAQSAANMAVAHLEAQKETIKSDTYLLALATYALTMANSMIKDELKMALDSKAKGEGGVKYWSNSDATTTPANDADARRVPYYNHRPPSADVEMTGYALLAYLERGTQNDFADAAGIAKWLTQQRNSYGGYSSTQDTVIGLQALSEYASQLNEGTRNINIAISSSSPDDTQELVINDANSIVYQQVELTATSGSVTVVVSGTGNCLIQFNVDYNLNKENTQNNYIFNVVVTDTDRNRVDVELCGRYKGEETQPGMGIMFGGIFSGFEAIGEDLNTMVQNEVNIARYETDAQGVTFYLNDVGQHTCATVPLQRTKPVANTQPVQASLYRYYAPDDQDVQIVTSEILARTDVCEVCGSNCNNCDDTDPGSAVKNIVNTALVMLLSALTLIIHKFM
ncbi:CD109 antigen-like [Amphiura filiformis]|uniref:CD109 antigen-like n=1 Tax=Amphiura filiformis TaxID=82378 RepID=UPI003B21EE9D